MVQTYRQKLVNNLVDSGRLQQTRELVPNQFAEKIVPVVDVNPHPKQVSNIVRGLSNNVTDGIALYSVPTGKRCFITSAWTNFQKDVLCDNASGVYLEIVPIESNALATLALIRGITLTIDSKSTSLNFAQPIEVKGEIVLRGTFAAGAMVKVGGFTALEIDA